MALPQKTPRVYLEATQKIGPDGEEGNMTHHKSPPNFNCILTANGSQNQDSNINQVDNAQHELWRTELKHFNQYPLDRAPFDAPARSRIYRRRLTYLKRVRRPGPPLQHQRANLPTTIRKWRRLSTTLPNGSEQHRVAGRWDEQGTDRPQTRII